MSFLISEAAAPSTPSANKVAVYAKSDGRVYGKDDAGTEYNMSGVTSGTTVTASGTSVDFTGLPSWVKRISVLFSGISLNGTSDYLFQIGDSGGIEASGYSAVSSVCGAATAGTSFTAGFGIPSSSAANVYYGKLDICLLDFATNTWSCSGVFANTNSTVTVQVAGAKALSATLDRVRITSSGGVNTFDAGTVNILYE